MTENTAFLGLIGFAVLVPQPAQEFIFISLFVGCGAYMLYKG